MSANESAAGAAGAAGAETKKRKNMSSDERRAALDELLARSNNGTIRRGDFGVAGDQFGTTRHTMARLWKHYQQEKAAGKSSPAVNNRRKGNSGGKSKDLTPFKEALRDIPLKLRTTQRLIAAALGMSRTTFQRHMKDLGVKPHTRYLKPLLTNTGKIQRLKWARRWTTTPAGGIPGTISCRPRVTNIVFFRYLALTLCGTHCEGRWLKLTIFEPYPNRAYIVGFSKRAYIMGQRKYKLLGVVNTILFGLRIGPRTKRALM